MKNILIIGAGVAGTDVAREIKLSSDLNMKVVGYIDDDKNKLNNSFKGSKVLGNSNDIKPIVKKLAVDEIIIAIPSAQGEYINKFVNIAIDLGISYKIVPRVREIIEGKATLSAIRRVEVTDLIGRPVVKDDVQDLKSFFKNKVVLVTGAAGSIGSELSSQIVAYNPQKIVLFDIWENGIFELKQKFVEVGFVKNVTYIIGNIQDIGRLQQVFKLYKPNYVFHVAAYKHVPLMEENPIEAIKNNIIGTYNISNISKKHKVERFVLVSTDKAADPKSVMGMTKLFAEMIVRSTKAFTKYMTVRFGNVLDSNGSVVPLFRKQIANGGPVTVTHKKMTRYFMTIPEASSLILKSAYLGKGGELFVLDMGKPVSILDLAQKMIRLSGLIPDKDINIVYTGIRKGEKLTEKLFTDTEKLDMTKDNKIFVSKNGSLLKDINSQLIKINKLISDVTIKNVKASLKKIINEK
ncbi:MAG: nucleoside-diphosphate sugar epimerase/dehydratase [Patescibacteria group bacterium]